MHTPLPNSRRFPLKLKTFLRKGMWLAGTAVLAFAAGLYLRPQIKDDRISQFIARYVDQQPRHKQKPDHQGVFDTVAETDFASLIDIGDEADIARKRRDLTAFIWRNAEAPFDRLPDVVEDGSILPFIDIDSAASVERLEIRMPLGVNSVVFDIRPKRPTSCLMLYQEGHRVSFLARKGLIRRLVDAGCEVVALSLPLTGGDNSRPEIDHPRFGRILLNDPDKLELLETETFSTLQFFLTPPIVALNHVLAQRHFDRVGMAGFSGGGWVTELVAALDPRVQHSYAVAGSVPSTVHAAAPEWGSYEQRLARLYDIANYPELYVMAASSPSRRHFQFYNIADPCCFSGNNWRFWHRAVADRTRQLGGVFDIIPYEQPDAHRLGREVGSKIVADFADPAKTGPIADKPSESR